MDILEVRKISENYPIPHLIFRKECKSHEDVVEIFDYLDSIDESQYIGEIDNLKLLIRFFYLNDEQKEKYSKLIKRLEKKFKR